MSRLIHARVLASSRRRPEDRVDVLERDDALVVVVADGAGGMHGGARAADALVRAVSSAVADHAFDVESVAAWSNVFRESDADLAAKMSGETTAVLIVVTPRCLAGVSAGDSEAWVITPAGIDDLTTGQSKKRLGSGLAAPAPFFRPSLDGVLVAGTDGLFKCVAAKDMAAAARECAPAHLVERLVVLARLPSGAYQDDVGVVVVRR